MKIVTSGFEICISVRKDKVSKENSLDLSGTGGDIELTPDSKRSTRGPRFMYFHFCIYKRKTIVRLFWPYDGK